MKIDDFVSEIILGPKQKRSSHYHLHFCRNRECVVQWACMEGGCNKSVRKLCFRCEAKGDPDPTYDRIKEGI